MCIYIYIYKYKYNIYKTFLYKIINNYIKSVFTYFYKILYKIYLKNAYIVQQTIKLIIKYLSY